MKKTLHLLFILLLVFQVAVKAQDRIYWGIPGPNGNISSAKLDGTDIKVSVALSGQTFDMETDFYKGILYWGDGRFVKKANTDGTNLQTLYNTGTNQIGGLALDLINNKLYFSDYGSANVTIRRCNLDGTGMEVIVTSPNYSNGRTYNLTISPTLQKLYWTESTISNANSIIMRCNLDGTNIETLKATTSFIPGLTIDEKNQRLYLAYYTDSKVMTTDMTCSTTPTLLFGSSNGTFQMAVSNVDEKLYFAELTTKKIRSCNLDGSSPQDIGSSLSGRPYALAIPTVPPAPTIYANETYTFELNDFLFASVDKNLLTKIKITTLTGKGTLYLDANSNNIVDAGEAVVLNQEIPKTDIVAGTLKFNPVANDYGSPYTTFNFKWFDGSSYSTLDYLQYIYVLSVAPTVTTQAVSDIGSTTATGNGNITNLGVPFPTSYGVCWNTTGLPTTSDSKVDKGSISTTGAFTAAMTGLTANTTYKARAYAINEAGTSYGTEVTFTTTNLIAPTATTGTATGITSTGAILNGSINANNTSTTVTFEYGLDTSYGTTVTAVESPVTGSSATSVSKAITGLSANTTYHYRVIGMNSGGTVNGSDQSFTTLAANSAPTDISISASSVNENVAGNTTVGTFSSTDPDAADTFTYTLVSGTGSTDNASFNISGSNLRITNSSDFETKSSYSVRIRTTDQGSLYYEKAFTITINDVNETPSDIALSNSSVVENVAINTTVGSFSSTDPDASNTFTYSLVSGTGDTDNASFNVSGNSLRVSVVPDYATQSSYSVRIRTTDQGGLFYEESYVVSVIALPKAPNAGSNSYIYDGTVKTAAANVGVGETIDWYANATGTATATAPSGTNVGTYSAYAEARNTTSGLVSKDRTLITLTINKAVLTVSADDKTKVYGAVNPTLTFQYSGWVNGVESIDTPPTIATTVTSTTEVGTYTGTITLSGGSDNNYVFTYVPADFEVTAATLTVTAYAKTKGYGDVNPPLTFKYSGWKNTDNETVLDTKPTVSTTVGLLTNAGTHTDVISVSGGSDNNYSFAYVPASFTVTKAMLTVTADAKTKVYGDANPALTFQYSGWKNEETETVLDNKPTASTTISASTPAGAYEHAITVSGGNDKNYDFTYISASFSVKKGTLVIWLDQKTKNYGDENPTLTYRYTGFMNGDDESDLDYIPYPSTSVTRNTNAGTYISSIAMTGGLDNNYLMVNVPANFIVNKAPLTVKADDKTKAYGETNPELTVQYNGWVNGDDETVLDTKPTTSTKVDQATDVGTYEITVAGGLDNNYAISTYTPGEMEVTKATLIVTADNKTKVYGDTNPELTFQYSGWVNGENETVLDTKPTASTTVNEATSVGSYKITLAGGKDNNYAFLCFAGNFEVTAPKIAGDINGDGKITTPEIAGDADGNGKIEGSEIAGDINGDWKIALPELKGDVNGNGKIDGSEIAGDANGNGKIDGTETTTGIDHQENIGKLSAWAVRNTEIRLKGQVSKVAIATLYDIQGKVILVANLAEGDLNIIQTSSIRTGVYLLFVKDNERMESFKILVRE